MVKIRSFSSQSSFIALILLRRLQDQMEWTISSERMIKVMNSAKATPLKDDYYKLQANTDMTKLNQL